jgi:hypothetical protein
MIRVDVLLERHYRRFLGKPSHRTEIPLPGGEKFSIEEFERQPCEGASTLVSFGLAERQAKQALHHNHELLFCCQQRFVSLDLAKVIGSIVTKVIQTGKPLFRGDVLGPAGPLLPGVPVEALYVCPPSYFKEPFFKFQASDDVDVHILWLIPIHRGEAEWVRQRGWSEFESLLQAKNPDLLDLKRPSIV